MAAVNAMIKECHIRNFSIYEREINGKTYLFAYLEYTGTDFDADMKKMAADPETQRWWKQTDPCQSPLPDAAQGRQDLVRHQGSVSPRLKHEIRNKEFRNPISSDNPFHSI